MLQTRIIVAENNAILILFQNLFQVKFIIICQPYKDVFEIRSKRILDNNDNRDDEKSETQHQDQDQNNEIPKFSNQPQNNTEQFSTEPQYNYNTLTNKTQICPPETEQNQGDINNNTQSNQSDYASNSTSQNTTNSNIRGFEVFNLIWIKRKFSIAIWKIKIQSSVQVSLKDCCQVLLFNEMNHSLKKRLAEEYFNTHPSGDISRQFLDGVQYKAIKGLFASYAFNRFTQYGKLNSLYKFYQYQKTVKETKENLQQLLTGALWTFLYQYAKKGQVLSILREYGSVFKTHRLLRQNLYALFLPFAIAKEYTFIHYHDHFEQLWQVHANRLNKNDLSGTQYPKDLRAPRRDVFINKWQ